MTVKILSNEETIRKLENKTKQLRQRLIEAQARNYDLHYAGKPIPTEADLKARIDWLESEIERLSAERKTLREKVDNFERRYTDDGK